MPSLRNRLILSIFSLTLGLAGCMATTRPDLPTAAADPVLQGAGQAFAAPSGDWPVEAWWTSFQDPTLTRLIERAQAANPDLKSASARARATAALADVQAAAQRPSLSASASMTRERLSESGLAPPPYGGSWLTAGDVSAALNWKLDLFGATRARVAARRLDAEAARADAGFARSATGAATARLYFELSAALADREVLGAMHGQRESLLRVTRARHDAGLDSTADLRHSEAQVPTLDLDVARADERVQVTRHALAALLGAGPDEFASLAPQALAPLPDWGVPADARLSLLARRADIGAARARVEAAAHDVDAVRRDFLPDLSLSAVAGLNSLVPSLLFNGSSRQFSAGPALSLPIYAGGRRHGATAAQRATFDGARAEYERVVVSAVQEVADAISRLNASAASRRAATAALTAEREAYRIAELRYRNGLGNLIELLSIQDRVLAFERQVASLECRERQLRVDLYEALGGGLPSVGAAS